jgi:serine/threonine-protein kinase
MINQTISHYKILEKLGEGGMGVVYKAEDTKLKRDVALKFLPSHTIASEDDKQRFIQEAQAAASLSHANIATVFGIDEHNEDMFIAMEYIEGQTLKDKISEGPLKLKDAVKIAKQIAEGLAAAHEKGVVHRDIKSANIMLTGKNQVKIMDFGLAKMAAGSMVTKAGTTLGTIAYMSPEQARGETVDHRSDIFSLGVILYEMITGQLPFKGEYETAIVYSIMNVDPEPLTAVRTGVPMDFEKIVSKLLAKDPDDRYQNIIELPVDLKNVDMTSTGTSQITTESLMAQAGRKQKFWQRAVMWQAATFIGIIVTFIVVWYLKPGPAQIPRPTYINQYELPSDSRLRFSSGSGIAISPDGRNIAFVADADEGVMIFIKPSGKLESYPLPGTESAIYPFFSPDGRTLGFIAGGRLMRIDIDGTNLSKIADIEFPYSQYARGAAWNEDKTIIFGVHGSGLLRVADSGEIPEYITTARDTSIGVKAHYWPHVLPGGRHVLFTIYPYGDKLENARTGILSLETYEWETLIPTESYNARYVPSYGPSKGHIVYIRQGGLNAVPFDLEKLKITGTPEPLPEEINTRNNSAAGEAFYSVSSNGTLVYIATGEDAASERNLVWVDRNSNETSLNVEEGSFSVPRISPDGRKIAVAKEIDPNERGDIWIYNIEGGTPYQMTTGGVWTFAWTPDSKEIVFSSSSNSYDIFSQPVDGSEEPELLYASQYNAFPTSCSRDGMLVFWELSPDNIRDIYLLDLETKEVEEYLKTEFNEFNAVFSPDGRWIAYNSNEIQDRLNVIVRPYPIRGDVKWPISIDGGRSPVWSPDGKHLYYSDYSDNLIEVSYETDPVFTVTGSEELFRGGYRSVGPWAYWDFHPDDFRILKFKDLGEPNKFYFKTNWFEELKAKFKDENK